MYLHHYTAKEIKDTKKNIIFYFHCALYLLSGATFAFDVAWIIFQVSNNNLLP
jgi:hypothetical protein